MLNTMPETAVNKLILMFVFEKMEIPLSNSSIIDICTHRNAWLNYMECEEIIMQLMGTKLIYKASEHSSEPYYALTFEGRNCLSMFYNMIPQSLRDEISNYCKLNIQNIKRRQEYVSKYEKMADGGYTATFTIREPLLGTLFEMSVKMDSRTSAINATKKWIDKAPEIYEAIFVNLLTDEEK